MEYSVFLDSDVVIDIFIDREPFANPASELFELSEKGVLQIYISALDINNIQYITRKFLGHVKSVEIIESLTEMVEIIGTTKAEILQALKNDFSDFEDSIQYSSA